MSARHFVLGLAVLAAGILVGISYSLEALPDDVHAPAINQVEVALLKRLDQFDARMHTQSVESRNQFLRLSRGLESLRDQVEAMSAGTSPATPAARSVAAAAPVAPVAREIHAAERSAERAGQLAAFANWKGDAALRAQWESVPEEDVRRRLGTPDRLRVTATGSDSMTYWNLDGDKVVSAVKIRLDKGRVAAVDVESVAR